LFAEIDLDNVKAVVLPSPVNSSLTNDDELPPLPPEPAKAPHSLV